MTIHLDGFSILLIAVVFGASLFAAFEIGAAAVRTHHRRLWSNDAAAIARAKRQRKHRLYPPT